MYRVPDLIKHTSSIFIIKSQSFHMYWFYICLNQKSYAGNLQYETVVLLYCFCVVFFYVSRWEDLAVGAPEFFVKDGLVGGAVYIYINNRGKKWEKIAPVQLLGHEDSMFGLAVESIGDVNQDGYGGWDVLISVDHALTKLTARKQESMLCLIFKTYWVIHQYPCEGC